jgi:hypothetical protein
MSSVSREWPSIDHAPQAVHTPDDRILIPIIMDEAFAVKVLENDYNNN